MLCYLDQAFECVLTFTDDKETANKVKEYSRQLEEIESQFGFDPVQPQSQSQGEGEGVERQRLTLQERNTILDGAYRLRGQNDRIRDIQRIGEETGATHKPVGCKHIWRRGRSPLFVIDIYPL